jgi:hypothetical protein
MAEESAGSAAEKVIGIVIAALLAALPSLTAGITGVIGSMLAAVLSVLGVISGPVALLIYRRYVGVLGAGARPKGSPARLAYDALRESLSEGNITTRLYARWLSAFLDAVDRFVGDAGLADRTLFPRAFGLQTPAPLWTASSLNRCLLLSLIYPIATILLIWAVSGHVGPAEAVLGLKPGLSGWSRGFVAAAVGLQGFAIWRFIRTTGRKSFAWLAVALTVAGTLVAGGAVIGAYPFAGFVAIGLAIAFGSYFLIVIVSAGAGHGGCILAPILAFIFAVVFAFVVALILAIGGAGLLGVLGTFVVVLVLAFLFGLTFCFFGLVNDQEKDVLSAYSVPVFILLCLGAAYLLSPFKIWETLGPFVLFLGLLTSLNAPFNWGSLGLTRALLRRGLELGGWWPYLLALVDAILAGVVVAALAITMVIGVQAFDGLAMHRGGTPVLPLDALFNGIAAHPADPEYWWVYALLLSTVIPSLINLMIGGASLLRGVPAMPSLILRFMPVGKAVPDFDRAWIALVLTLQIVVGVILGVAAQALLVVVVIGYVMPWLGLGLLDMARDVAAFNLPLRIGQPFAGIF